MLVAAYNAEEEREREKLPKCDDTLSRRGIAHGRAHAHSPAAAKIYMENMNNANSRHCDDYIGKPARARHCHCRNNNLRTAGSMGLRIYAMFSYICILTGRSSRAVRNIFLVRVLLMSVHVEIRNFCQNIYYIHIEI